MSFLVKHHASRTWGSQEIEALQVNYALDLAMIFHGCKKPSSKSVKMAKQVISPLAKRLLSGGRIHAFCILLLLSAISMGCGHPLQNPGQDASGNDTHLEDELSRIKKMAYDDVFAKRGEYPMDTSVAGDLLRLHYDPWSAPARTYTIHRVPRERSPFGALVKPAGHKFILRTKALEDWNAAYKINYSVNTQIVDQEYKNSGPSWRMLLHMIDSLGVFRLQGSQVGDFWGRSDCFVLEMKVDSTYKEIYFGAPPSEGGHVFTSILKAFEQSCPPALDGAK